MSTCITINDVNTSLKLLLMSGKMGEGGGAVCDFPDLSPIGVASELLLDVSPSSLKEK